MYDEIFKKKIPEIDVERVRRDSDFTMDIKHFHDDYEIYYLMSGDRYYFIGQQIYHIKKGGLALINSHEIHKTGQVKEAFHDRILIEIKKDPFSEFLSFTNELYLDTFFAHTNRVYQLNEEEQRCTENLLFEIMDVFNDDNPGCRLIAMSRIAELLFYFKKILAKYDDRLQPAVKPDSYKHIKVSEVSEYLSAHYDTAGSLEAVAEHFFMNKSYLSRIYKELTGLTVTEYLNIRRIQKAQQLLISTSLNVTKIAEAVGYDSITYFERVFKKYSEVSPLKYRTRALITAQKTTLQ